MDKIGNYNFDISNEFYMTRLGSDGLPVAGAHVVMEGILVYSPFIDLLLQFISHKSLKTIKA